MLLFYEQWYLFPTVNHIDKKIVPGKIQLNGGVWHFNPLRKEIQSKKTYGFNPKRAEIRYPKNINKKKLAVITEFDIIPK